MSVEAPVEVTTHFPLAVFIRGGDSYLACPYELTPDENVTFEISTEDTAVGRVTAVPIGEEEHPAKKYLITPSKIGDRAIITANMQYYHAKPKTVILRPNFSNRPEEAKALAGIHLRDFDHGTTHQALLAAHQQRISRYPHLYSAGFGVEALKSVYERLLYNTPRY